MEFSVSCTSPLKWLKSCWIRIGRCGEEGVQPLHLPNVWAVNCVWGLIKRAKQPEERGFVRLPSCCDMIENSLGSFGNNSASGSVLMMNFILIYESFTRIYGEPLSLLFCAGFSHGNKFHEIFYLCSERPLNELPLITVFRCFAEVFRELSGITQGQQQPLSDPGGVTWRLAASVS